jgi:hypothetical protein
MENEILLKENKDRFVIGDLAYWNKQDGRRVCDLQCIKTNLLCIECGQTG